jgi:hypothetical protein
MRSGSTTARLPWTHLGSPGLSQGLLTGSKKGTIHTRETLRLTSDYEPRSTPGPPAICARRRCPK